MLSDSLQNELNLQINRELESAYIYFSMAADLELRSLDGFAHWMKTQAQEEVAHAMKIYQYLIDQGAKVTLLALPQPQTEFSSPLEVFEKALEHEKKIADSLNSLSDLAMKERDNTTYSFLEWFLTEQVEEISTASGIVDKVRMVGDNGHGLLMLDSELGKRQLLATDK